MSSNYSFRTGPLPLNEKYATFSMQKRGEHILHIELNRPEDLNSTDLQFYDDFNDFFTKVSYERNIRCIVITAAGKHFCAGLDLKETAGTLFTFEDDKDHARKALILEERIIHMQNALTAIEKCRWPVVVGVHGGCIGAGVDMITACDIVYCTQDSFFSIKEVDIGMTADIGTFQRLPIITSNWHLLKEYALTGDRISADEAVKLGLVGRVYKDQEELRSKSNYNLRARI